MSTIELNMSTDLDAEAISRTLFGQTRRAVLGLLYGQIQEALYLRQIARRVGTGHGAVQRELNHLADAGIILRKRLGKEVYYQANPRCPVFAELKSLILKTVGLADLLRRALGPLSEKMNAAFIYGSFARGRERADSDVDLMIIGQVSFAQVSKALDAVQERLGREVNPTVYSVAEFKTKLASGHPFLNAVIAAEKIFLIGDEDELAGLAGKRLAG